MAKDELCKKVTEIYPDIEKSGIAIDVTHHEQKKRG